MTRTATATAEDLVSAVESSAYVKCRQLLRHNKSSPDSPYAGVLPLALAVERRDIACVALLISFNADPDVRGADGVPTARELATRMLRGEHADTSTRAGRLAQRGGRMGGGGGNEKDTAERILRLFSAPQGDEAVSLAKAFDKRIDCLEVEERAATTRSAYLRLLLFVVVAVLYLSGLWERFGEKDTREL